MTSIPAPPLSASPVPSGPQDRLPRRLARSHQARAAPPQPPGRAVALDADRQAQFAATAQALGVSLSAARALLAVLLGDDRGGARSACRRRGRGGIRGHPATAGDIPRH